MEAGGGFRDERVPQWGAQETRELIAARGELEREAAASTGRSAKTLWEAVADALRARGYRRTADQCKCKWKNLVNRYKGKETSDPENGRHCPFFEELHAVFTERARNMQRQLLQSESGASVKKKLKRPSGDRSPGESDDEEDDAEATEDEKPMRSKKRNAGGDKGQQSQRTAENSRAGSSSIHDLLQDFLVQQQHMDMQWHETMERRAQERLVFEQEWRQSMRKLEQERLVLEHEWIQREEQRRMREEARAQKRDSLMTALLNKLLHEDL
ncbi:trihelix transcription factor GT-3b-like [Lolium rigidum]|uniref:trihelix transcription factor GT-3b-like n=1 Tax=Lolium rigidum TaxID=89674 RepID=UPI001F5D36B7|nr:trihelix transcription factor GT-3b-like [Lolium rigidum]